MTLREIHIALKYIDTRKHNNYAMQAALHGHKLKLKGASTKEPETSFTKEESEAADRAMQKAMMRRRQMGK